MNKTEFLEKWIHTFAPNITKSQYKKRIDKQFIWHAFSWNIIPKENYLEGDEARNAYNNVDKNGAICLQLWFDETTTLLTKDFDSAEKIETPDGDYAEFYVVGKNFSWTYIVTHEGSWGLGPYFMNNYYDEPQDIDYVIFKTSQKILEERNGGIYEATRYAWKVNGKRIEKYKYVFGVIDNIVLAVYCVKEWHKITSGIYAGRYEFIGCDASSEIASRFIGKRIPFKYSKPGSANPVAYKK